MDTEQRQVRGDSLDASGKSGLWGPLRAALAGAAESERYRLLADLLSELADAGTDGRTQAATPEVEALSRKVHTLTEERASLEDKLASLRADLTHRTKQLEAEQTRGHEIEVLGKEQRARLKSLQNDHEHLEAQLVAKNAELHKAHIENEQLLRNLQRAELGKDDQSKVERVESAKRELAKEVETLRKHIEQLRADKNAEIARLNDELAKHASAKPQAAEVPFSLAWERLASQKPPFVDRQARPSPQCAERLADGFVELVRFADDFDQLIRPFLSKYTKHSPQIKVPWEVYAKRDNTRKTVEQTLAAVGGKPIGLVKVRLRGLYAWTEAAMIGCDAAVESIASELHTFLMGPAGAGSDPNRTIKDFLRDDGHELFLQHIRSLRGVKLAEAFGRGG